MSSEITLVVTSRGRVSALQRLFESLLLQDMSNFTIILGDQNRPAVLNELVACYNSSLRIKRVMLSPQSLSMARNSLLPLVDGKYIAFTDDDCYYARDCFSRVISFFSDNKIDALICNPNGKCTKNTNIESKYSVFKDAPSWVLFFSRRAIEKVGMFDESLGIGSDGPYQSGEETDYLVRLLGAGGVVLRASHPVVYHDEVNYSDLGCINKAYFYAVGRMQLLRKHRFPLWFKVVNVFYPLAQLVFEPLNRRAYRLSIFKGRLSGLFSINDTFCNP